MAIDSRRLRKLSVWCPFLLLVASRVSPAVSLSSLSMSAPPGPVAVIGTTGRLGRQAVLKLIRADVPVRCLLRKPVDPSLAVPDAIDKDSSGAEVAAHLASLPGVTMVGGDVTDTASLDELLEGCTAVLALHGPGATKPFWKSLIPFLNSDEQPTHSKQINFEGVRKIISAAERSGTVRRIVRVTGKGEDPYGIFSILINMLGSMAKAWNYEGEQLLRSSKMDYTIVRPGVMGPDNVPTGKVLALGDNGADLKVSAVRHEDIASLCVDCLDYSNAARSTLTAMNVDPGLGEETYAPLLKKVVADSRAFPDNMMEEHRKAARRGAAILVGFLAIAVKVAVLPFVQFVAGSLGGLFS